MGLTFWKLPYSNIVGLCNWGPDPDDVGIYIYISNLQIDIDIYTSMYIHACIYMWMYKYIDAICIFKSICVYV